ncbi:MAG TPA: hypothetical protein VEN81_15380 [Planctomycetota bacterium]|nr:hypothetical protein [Planctomycetota bacterium]
MTIGFLLASSRGDPPLVFFGIIAVLGLGVTLITRSQRRSRMEAVAQYFRGQLLTSSWSGDRIELAVDGIPAQVSYDPGGRSRRTTTRIHFNFSPPGVLRIGPENFFASFRKAFGAQDIEFGDSRFDGAFLVQGGPEPWVRDVLVPEARRKIRELSEMGASWLGSPNVKIDVGPAGVAIFCEKNLTGETSNLIRFVQLATEVFRQIRTPVTPGITILSAQEHAEQGGCPVCACPLGPPVRRCPTCGTSHHADCWEYFGGCAIYGCARRGGRG